ncbi:MAG: lytic transglycosylase domain-containing protein [Alphaproteobacteria bacterium]|nr:lytic transglycosylase domain-containing protein [Alphaproteobacteria bacterium]
MRMLCSCDVSIMDGMPCLLGILIAAAPSRAEGVFFANPNSNLMAGPGAETAVVTVLDVADPFDPRQNIEGGMKYLRWLLGYFAGDTVLAVAAYNAGEQAVKKHGGIPPYDETRAYVRKVFGLYKGELTASSSGGDVAAAAADAPQAPRPEASKTAAASSCFEIGSDKIVRPC